MMVSLRCLIRRERLDLANVQRGIKCKFRWLGHYTTLTGEAGQVVFSNGNAKTTYCVAGAG